MYADAIEVQQPIGNSMHAHIKTSNNDKHLHPNGKFSKAELVKVANIIDNPNEICHATLQVSLPKVIKSGYAMRVP